MLRELTTTPPSTSLPCSQLGSLDLSHLCGNIEGGCVPRKTPALLQFPPSNLCLDTLCCAFQRSLTSHKPAALRGGGGTPSPLILSFFFLNKQPIFLLYLPHQDFLPTFFMCDGWSRMCENNLSSTHQDLVSLLSPLIASSFRAQSSAFGQVGPACLSRPHVGEERRTLQRNPEPGHGNV